MQRTCAFISATFFHTIRPPPPPPERLPCIFPSVVVGDALDRSDLWCAIAFRDADAEHVLKTETALVDRFVSEEAVLRVALETIGVCGDADNGTGEEEAAAVSRVDKDHLHNVLEEVRLRTVQSGIHGPFLCEVYLRTLLREPTRAQRTPLHLQHARKLSQSTLLTALYCSFLRPF